MVGLPGIEPGTSRLSGVRSNRLSYKPTRRVLERRNVRENTVARSLSKITIIVNSENMFTCRDRPPHYTLVRETGLPSHYRPYRVCK